jgi:hypothetical protein
MSLTDANMYAIYEAHHNSGSPCKPGFWSYERAIESSAAAPLLERIAELEQRNRDLYEDVQRFKAHALNEKDARMALERELEAVRKDAERYRWLRENRAQDEEPEGISGPMYSDVYFRWFSPRWKNGKRIEPVTIDAAIDAAMKTDPNEKLTR